MKNVLWYLGFLSFLSLLYFIEHDAGFLLFLSFLLFFFTYFIKQDERLNHNLGRASRNAFLYTMLSSAAAILYVNLQQNTSLYQWGFAFVIIGTLAICVLSFLYYDSTGH